VQERISEQEPGKQQSAPPFTPSHDNECVLKSAPVHARGRGALCICAS
jgi:hypothetical protein